MCQKGQACRSFVCVFRSLASHCPCGRGFALHPPASPQLGVQGDKVPGPYVEAVISLSLLAGRGPEVLEVSGGAGVRRGCSPFPP